MGVSESSAYLAASSQNLDLLAESIRIVCKASADPGCGWSHRPEREGGANGKSAFSSLLNDFRRTIVPSKKLHLSTSWGRRFGCSPKMVLPFVLANIFEAESGDDGYNDNHQEDNMTVPSGRKETATRQLG